MTLYSSLVIVAFNVIVCEKIFCLDTTTTVVVHFSTPTMAGTLLGIYDGEDNDDDERRAEEGRRTTRSRIGPGTDQRTREAEPRAARIGGHIG
jgi:hypothetical protein